MLLARRLTLLICLILLIGTSGNSQPMPVKLRFLEGYYPIGNIVFKKGLNFWVFNDQRTFERYFGKIEKKGAPDFELEEVVAMAMPPAKKESFLSFEPKGSVAGNFIEIYCSAKKDLYKLPYVSYPIVIAAIPRYFRVSKINFYDLKTKKLLESVSIGK